MPVIDLDEHRKVQEFLDDLTEFFGGDKVEVTLTLPQNYLDAITDDDLTPEQALYLELFTDKLSFVLSTFVNQFGERAIEVADTLVDKVYAFIPGVSSVTVEKGGTE